MSVSRHSHFDFLEVDGNRLEYRRIDGTRHPDVTLVFLHDGLGCVDLWRDYPQRLAEHTGCGALWYSRLGYGRSDPVALPRPPTYMHDAALRELPRMLDAAATERVVLIGHSDGASIGVVYAGTAAAHADPGRAAELAPVALSGLVLLAPHVFVEALTLESIRATGEAYRTGRLREQLAVYHGDRVDGAFWGWHKAWLSAAFRTWDLRGMLGEIRVPTLVIQGEDDPYGTLAQVDSVCAGIVHAPVERRVLPRCGHAPQRDAADVTLAASARFIEGLLRGSG